MATDFSLRFWGVRGSIPCPGPATQRYGGNTPCIELRCGERLLILDAGTGLRALGDELLRVNGAIDADIFLSHCHYDHVGGIPFFAPFYKREHRFRLWAGNLLPAFRLKPTLQRMMSAPLFPIGTDAFAADIEFRDFSPGEVITPADGIAVRTLALDHPGGCIGYRIDYGGRALVYLTDTESPEDTPAAESIAFAKDADLLIYDTTYAEDEIAGKKGWGHSTFRAGARLADSAGARTLCLFHHAPEHDDVAMDALLAKARAQRPETIAAVEGATIRL